MPGPRPSDQPTDRPTDPKELQMRARRRPAHPRPATWAVLLALVAVAACAPGGDRDPTPSPSRGASPTPTATGTTGSPAPELAQTCRFEADGFAITVPYPQDWHTNATEPAPEPAATDAAGAEPPPVPPCRVFHHEPFELPRAWELTGYDLFVRVEQVPFDRVTAGDGDPISEQLSREEVQVDGRQAVVREFRATEDGMAGPAGSRHTVYAVDLGDARTLIAVTYEVGDLDYARNVAVLHAVMDKLTIAEGAAVNCSADDPDLPRTPSAQPELPAAVAQTRSAIYQAAIDCDHDALAELAGDMFSYSFGEGGDPAGYWRREEADGAEPMRYLAGMLNRPSGTVTLQGDTGFVWPSVAAYDSWEEVPPDAREALRPLYDEQDFADFAQFGGYIGYRVWIAEDGTWQAFVAGD